MNHSILSANRTTHMKIVIVALVAAIAVVTIGIAARLNASGVELAGHPSGPATAGVVKAKPSTVWTHTNGVTIR